MESLNSIAFSIFSNKGVYALLLGSGISKSSGIPTGWEITLDLIKKVATLEGETPINYEQWYVEKFKEQPDYSNLLAKLAVTPSERLNLLKPYFEHVNTGNDNDDETKQPTLAHRSIAKLVRKEYIKVIITTNFDKLLEIALREEGIEPTIIKHPTDIEGATPLVHSKITIIKINGDYLDSRFLNTKVELEKYEALTHDYLKNLFNDFGLIVCGWSGQWDIGLINILRESSNFRYSNFWTYLNTIQPEFEDLAKFRKGTLIKIDGADNFFNDITEKIEALEQINQHPLSLDMAISMVKKYIAQDKYKIKLHDLLRSESDKIYQKTIENFNSELQPTTENIKEIFNNAEKNISFILPLIINTVKWSNDDHNEYITNLILRLCKPPVNYPKQRFELTDKLRYLSPTIILYAIGVMCIKTKKYKLLNDCLNLKVYLDDNSKNEFLINTTNCALINIDDYNTIFQKRYRTPLSTHISTLLEPNFENFIFTKAEFHEVFMLFEYILALSYLEKNFQFSPWAPIGEFAWRMHSYYNKEENMITLFNKKADNEKENWEVIKVGMFDHSYITYIEQREKLENFLKNIRY